MYYTYFLYFTSSQCLCIWYNICWYHNIQEATKSKSRKNCDLSLFVMMCGETTTEGEKQTTGGCGCVFRLGGKFYKSYRERFGP